jgi:hypothetical protein
MKAYGLAFHTNNSQTHPRHPRSRNCDRIGDCLQGVFKGSPVILLTVVAAKLHLAGEPVAGAADCLL